MKLTLSGSLPVMNSESHTPPRPLSHSTRQPQQQKQPPQPQHRLLPRGNSRKQAAATAEQQLATVQASKKKRNGLSAEGEEAANKGRLAGQRQIATVSQFGCGDSSGAQLLCTEALVGNHEGEAVWQGEEE